ncbi:MULTISPECIES: DUF6343 family protein [unclassified Streptomyces]|uniref:DUF6343 family protein n=1 Tax=unclassified Streptomyces TaxID=2593676 RepID=UPI0019035E8E|nr:DUF6343 family protein [Streptomyces sp. HSG2]
MSGRHRREPVPRSRSGAFGRRFPRTGTEPLTAQSPLRLRLLLSALFLPLFVAAAVLFGLWAARVEAGDEPGRGALVAVAAISAAAALMAAADLVTVVRRLRRERGA